MKGSADRKDRAHQLFQRGTRLLQQKNPEQAEALLLQARELGLESVDLLLNLSGAFILQKKFSRAVKVLEQARERDPENAMIWTNLGAAYLGNPLLADDESQLRAIAAFERALELDPAARSVAYNIGLIYRDRREYGAAARWFRRAVRTNPGDQHAHRLLDRMVARTEEE